MRFQVGLMYVWDASPTNLSYQFRVVHKIKININFKQPMYALQLNLVINILFERNSIVAFKGSRQRILKISLYKQVTTKTHHKS